MFRAICGLVLYAKDFGGFAPKFALPIRATHEVLLVVNAAEKDVAADS